jgi:hypothetical protein
VSYGNSRPACGPNGFIVGRGVGRLSFGYFDQPSAVEKRFFAVQRKVTRAKRGF